MSTPDSTSQPPADSRLSDLAAKLVSREAAFSRKSRKRQVEEVDATTKPLTNSGTVAGSPPERTAIVRGMALRFHPGQMSASRRVSALLSEAQRKELVRRHVSGDWEPTYRAKNERAVREGRDVFSEFLFSDEDGWPVTVWVLTESDRGRPVLMCPEESLYRSSDLEEATSPLFYGLPVPRVRSDKDTGVPQGQWLK